MRLLYCLCFCFTLCSLSAQQVSTSFGKNRIQFKDFEWVEHKTDNFVFYWYNGGKSIGSYTSILAEEAYSDIKKILQYRIRDKIHVIVYNDLTDFKQSNIGNDEVAQNTGGVTKIEGNKMFVYFNGNHKDLSIQVRHGIAQILINNLLFGQNVREMVQNTLLLELPDWFIESALQYIASSWTTEKDDDFRKIMQLSTVHSFADALNEDGVLAGQALWNYIIKTSGTNAFADILYITRVNRSLNQGFLYATSKNTHEVSEEVYTYYQNNYDEDLKLRSDLPEELGVNYKRRDAINSATLHPSLPIVAYSMNVDDQKKVFLYNYALDKEERVANISFKNPLQEADYKYPLLDWSPSGEYLAIAYERKDNLYLRMYDYRKKGTFDIEIENSFERWLSIDFFDEGQLVITAVKNGQSDVFLYDLKNRKPRQLTNDLYDDVDAAFVENEKVKGVVFSSNRNNTLQKKQSLNVIYPLAQTMDLFFLDLHTKELIRMTDTPEFDEYSSTIYQDSTVLYRSNQTGTFQLYTLSTGRFTEAGSDLSEQTSVSNYGYSIGLIDVNQQSSKVLVTGGESINAKIFVLDTLEKRFRIPSSTFFVKTDDVVFDSKVAIDDVFFQEEEEDKVEKRDTVFFYTPFDKKLEEQSSQDSLINEKPTSRIELEEKVVDTDIDKVVELFKSGKTIAHKRKFRTVEVTTQLDNGPLINGYTAFQVFDSRLNADLGLPTTTLNIQMDVRDLFEDYRIKAGVRIPLNLKGADYYITFMNLKNRIDQEYTVYRSKRSSEFLLSPLNVVENERNIKYISTGGEASFSYPFSIFSSLRFKSFVRHDNTGYSNLNGGSIAEPDVEEGRFGGRLSYVFDNSIDKRLNIWNGVKAKAYIEGHQRIELGTSEDKEFTLDDNGFLGVVGFDARKAIPVLKKSMFASRLVGSTTFGPQEIAYYLGEVEGSFARSFDRLIPTDNDTESIAYQSYVGQMRGFATNIRNGNTFILSNTEFRMPIVHYFTKRPIKSSILDNLQLVGFLDAGSAFSGLDPKSDDNELNRDVFEEPDSFGNILSSIEVEFFRTPFVYSYGAGLRTSLFGYFLKLDVGWGVDSGDHLPARGHLSIGKDF